MSVFSIYFLFGLPHRAMIGVQFVVQNFADHRLGIFPGMLAHRAVVADGRPYFFKSADVVCLHIILPFIGIYAALCL
jgi:hypothetical protein